MHADHRGTSTVGRPWVAVPRRRSTRRTALASALGLLAASLALPVVATPLSALADGPKTFTAVFEQDGLGVDSTFDITLTLENTSPPRGGGFGRELGSANVTIAGSGASFVTPQEDPQVDLVDETAQLRNLGLLPGDGDDYDLQLSASCGTTVTFNVIAKQSNDFSGAGNELTDQSDPDNLVVTLDCGLPPYLTGLDDGPCSSGSCTAGQEQNDHRVTASAASENGVLYAGFRQNDADPNQAIRQIAADFSLECEGLLRDRANKGEPARLAGEVAQVEPFGLDEDGEVTVRLLVPRSYVNLDENRSADIFTVCFLGDRGAFEGADPSLYEGLDLGTPYLPADSALGNKDLFGPVLLPMCDLTDGAAPCIESRQKVRADVELTVRIRASDPWMR